MQNKYITMKKKYLYIEPLVFSSSELGKSRRPILWLGQKLLHFTTLLYLIYQTKRNEQMFRAGRDAVKFSGMWFKIKETQSLARRAV